VHKVGGSTEDGERGVMAFSKIGGGKLWGLTTGKHTLFPNWGRSHRWSQHIRGNETQQEKSKHMRPLKK